ncbi:MAG: dihydroneopterin aldolase [Acidobacteriota bacterium]
MDKIHINGISCQALVGVPQKEREKPQQVVIDLTLSLDLESAAQSDRVESTVDYQEIVEKVESLISQESFQLLETLTAHVCQSVLTDVRIKTVLVKVRKFPELLKDRISSVEVEMTRTRD